MRRAALFLLWWTWAGGPVTPRDGTADATVGNIVVIETDPTVLQPGELFDLNNSTVTFTPRPGGGYTATVGALEFDSRLGSNLSLADDASVSVSLGFGFPFFGVNRTSVFVNSNGHLTFGAESLLPHFNAGGSVTSLGTDVSVILDRMASSTLPRIAALWQDWNPAAGGGVFANALADRLIVTWSGVPLFGTTTTATFQAVLFSSGVIQLNCQSVPTTPGGGYLVGVSPGSTSEFRTTTLDLSRGGSSLSSAPQGEPLVQVFGSTAGPLVHISAVARRVFQAQSDAFDQLVMFANFTHAMGDAFAFELTVRQTVSGLNLSLFNISSFFGSAGRLQSFLNMNRLDLYPNDPACLQNPTCRLPGSNDSVLTLLGQESGHMWLAQARFDDAGVCSDLLRGRDNSHWSFFHDTDASVMEGNSWVDNGNGTFTTDEDTLRFSALDQYIMGLRAAADVPPFFFISNPTNTGGRTPASSPETGVTVSGTRRNVTINQVQTCDGLRSPASGLTGVNPTATWRQAFVLLTRPGLPLPQGDISKLDAIRAGWGPFFNTATGGRGSADTTLPPTIVLAAAVLPGSRSVQVGTPATAFATIINPGPGTATACALSPGVSLPASFTFQTTNPATNQVTGTPDTPVDIPAGASQSFVFALTPTAPIAPTTVALSFDCANTAPAPSIPGVNTLLLSADTNPIPDIVALAATSPNDGIVRLPGATGAASFAVATANVGAAGTLTAAADTGGASLPLGLAVCETNPATGQCVSAVGSGVTTQIGAGATPTFAIFLTGAGAIPFDPAANRIFVRFRDSGGVTRGATSVAVRTE